MGADTLLRAAINMTNCMKDLCQSISNCPASPLHNSDTATERRNPTRIQEQSSSIMGAGSPIPAPASASGPKGEILSTTKGLGMSGRRANGGLGRGGSLERGRQKEGDNRIEKKKHRVYSLSLERRKSGDDHETERGRERVRGEERAEEIEDGVHVRSLKDMMRKVQQLEGELSGKGSNQNNKIGKMTVKNVPEKEVYLLTDLSTRVLEIERVMTDNQSHLTDLWDSERTTLLNAVQHSKSQIENLKLIQEGAILAVRSRYQNMLDQAQEALEIQTAAARGQIDRLEEMLRKSQLQIQLSKINPNEDVRIRVERREKEKIRGRNTDDDSDRGHESENEKDVANIERASNRPASDKKRTEKMTSKEGSRKSKSKLRKGDNIDLDENIQLSLSHIKNVDETPHTPSLFPSSCSSSSSSSSPASVPLSLSIAQSEEISDMRRLIVQTKLELEFARKSERETVSASITEIEKVKSEISSQNNVHEKIVADLEKRIVELQTEILILNDNTEKMILSSNEKERTYVDVQNDMRDGVYNSGGELGRRRRDDEERDRKIREEIELERRRRDEEDRENEREREKRRVEDEIIRRKKDDNEKQKTFALTVALKQAEDQILHMEGKYEAKCYEMEEMIR